MHQLELVLEVGDAELKAEGSLGKLEEAGCSPVEAGCNLEVVGCNRLAEELVDAASSSFELRRKVDKAVG